MFRSLITLLESQTTSHVWHGTTKERAKTLIYNPERTHGIFGYGFYVSESPSFAKNPEDDEWVILEYSVEANVRILDLNNEDDVRLWHHYQDHSPNAWKHLIRHGIDGVLNDAADGVCVYNLDALKFDRIYFGVIDDPLEETDTNLLDEVALGGLQRCTAVTINALLKDFNLRPILLKDVPVDHPGVLRVLNMMGLSYRPFPNEAGRTVQQFVNAHKMFDWYLLTPGHAMALIKGELFDAENKGPDGRKLQAVFQISRR